MDILSNIKIGLIAVGVAISSLFGAQPVQPSPNLGGTFVTPEVRALFTTSLASKITSTDTSMTLVSATDKDGNTLASSTYGFIIDEGTSVEEFVLADCTGTTCTNMTRGVSVSTGTTSVSTLKFEHRRGASVKITTAPSLVFAMNVLKGKQNLENVIRYDSSVATTTIDNDNRNLVNYELLAYTAFNGAGVIDASATQKGVVELATQVETASSTSNGSAGVLVIPASNATSTYNDATAPLRVVVTQNNGKIDQNFLPSTSVSTSSLAQFATSSINIGAFSAWDGFFKQRVVITTTGTTTFARPSGVNKVWVEVIGGGGKGGGASVGGSTAAAGGAAGAGGYAQEIVDLSATSSVQVYVAPAVTSGNGDRTTFGTIGFQFLSASGGTAGTDEGAGGLGGIGTGGDINMRGGSGQEGHAESSVRQWPGTVGGSSFYGSGGKGGECFGSGVSSAGGAGNNYGGGGGGGCADNSTSASGGDGAQGIIIIRW